MRRKRASDSDSPVEQQEGMVIIGRAAFQALSLDADDLAYMRTLFIGKVRDGQLWLFHRSERANRLLRLKE